MDWFTPILGLMNATIGWWRGRSDRSSGSPHQEVSNSAGVVQAGRDVTVNLPPAAPTSTTKGEAHFPHCGLSLDVTGFRTGDMRDEQYGATFGTIKSVFRFVAVLRAGDGDHFRIKDHQGWVSLSCTLKIAGGPYEGHVSYIEVAPFDENALELDCWFRAELP